MFTALRRRATALPEPAAAPPAGVRHSLSIAPAALRRLSEAHDARAPVGNAITPVAEAPSSPVADAAWHVESQDDLARLPQGVRRLLHAEFQLGEGASRLCPAQYEDGSVCLFAVAGHADSDQADELARMLAARHYRVGTPARVTVPAPLLLALVRGQVDVAQLSAAHRAAVSQPRAAMAEAFHDMVAWGVRQGASDLHANVRLAQAESEVRYTIGGRYVMPPRYARMPTATLMDILAVAWMDVRGGNGAVFDPMREQQGRLRMTVDGRAVMLRWASLATDAGPSVCLRLLPLEAPTVSSTLLDLGYLPSQIDMLERAGLAEGGAILLAGVVGSGKSTTIAALMAQVPAERKVITLEDPVEYLIPRALQNTVARPLDGSSADAFDAKLKTVKRSAMTDLLIGEIRDRETGRAFTDLAGSGTSLYSTVHAGSAMLIPERLASDFIGVPRDFLATPGILKLLVYQALLPRLCDACALPFDTLFQGPERAHWQRYAALLSQLYGADPARLRRCNPEGCVHCRNAQWPGANGLAGRTVVAEMIEPGLDDAVLRAVRNCDSVSLRRHLSRQRRTPYDAADMHGKSAMECAVYKVLHGQIDPRAVEPRFKAYATVALERATTSGRGSSGCLPLPAAPVSRRPAGRTRKQTPRGWRIGGRH